MLPLNFTENKIEDITERSILIFYLLTVFLSALVGDTLILLATMKEDALKLNKFLVTVMQHIAMSDLVLALVFILPTVVSLIAESWVFGDVLGDILKFLTQTVGDLSRILITVLAASKLFIIKFPLRAPILSVKIARISSIIILLSVMTIYGSFLVFDQCRLFFSHVEYFMACQIPSDQATNRYFGYAIATAIIPTFVVILVTAAILMHLLSAWKISRKCGGKVSWHGIVAVSTTATVFCVATIPYVISFIFIQSNWSDGSRIEGVNSLVFIRSSHFTTALNIMCNVYIYYFTIPTFRQFVKRKFTLILSGFLECFVPGDRGGNSGDIIHNGTSQLTYL